MAEAIDDAEALRICLPFSALECPWSSCIYGVSSGLRMESCSCAPEHGCMARSCQLEGNFHSCIAYLNGCYYFTYVCIQTAMLYVHVHVCACIHTGLQPLEWAWLRRTKRKSPATCFVSRYWFVIQSHTIMQAYMYIGLCQNQLVFVCVFLLLWSVYG